MNHSLAIIEFWHSRNLKSANTAAGTKWIKEHQTVGYVLRTSSKQLMEVKKYLSGTFFSRLIAGDIRENKTVVKTIHK